MTVSDALQAHLDSGATFLCRCWRLTRGDGMVAGFTDHDRDLTFDGTVFAASSGMTAHALELSGGLAADNSEALGALTSDVLNEADVRAGLWDGAEVEIWLVNWTDVDQRLLRFRGNLGQITRTDGAFRVELLGLSAQLGATPGRVFQKICPARLGDKACGFDVTGPGFQHSVTAWTVAENRILRFADPGGFADGWFSGGQVEGLQPLAVTIKDDRVEAGERVLELWQELRVAPVPGAQITLTAGCDKRFATCGAKFSNTANFQGFPHLPGDDWLATTPGSAGIMDGGSLMT